MATADLNEMLYAQDSDKVNIIIETGGTSRWRNSVISNTTNQRYRVTSKGLEAACRTTWGSRSMVDPATLADFIQYSKANYPADRYMLVLWDHGGGSLTGYGYDQNFRNDSMTLDEMATGLKNGGCTFDVIGFDACLMATLETAMVAGAVRRLHDRVGGDRAGHRLVLHGLADGPGQNTLHGDHRPRQEAHRRLRGPVQGPDAAEPGHPLPHRPGRAQGHGAVGVRVVRDVHERAHRREAAIRPSPMRAPTPRSSRRSSQINQIDLIDFAEKLGTPEARSFAEVLRGCIKYNRTTTNITNANGVSIFFPYGKLSQLNSMLSTYDQIGVSARIQRMHTQFRERARRGPGHLERQRQHARLAAGRPARAARQPVRPPAGRRVPEASGSLLEPFLGSGDLSSITGLLGGGKGWLDTDRMKSSVDYYEANQFDASALVITEKNGQRVMALSEEQWDLVQDIEQNVFLDDGEGFIDLGLDNVFEYNDDGDLIMEYDGTWLALNGQIVSYYMVSDDRSGDSYSIKGRVPAMLNGQLVDIILVFDDQNPDGVVLGAQPKYDAETETETVAKGLLDIVAGDKIDYLCDYYTYGGEYNDTYYLGDQYIATGEWVIENLSVGDLAYQMTYRLTDIYGNKYWTPSVSD